MTKDDLIALALQFRECKLWNELDDSMIFGVSLPNGETGYCCVMGNGGEHFALALYSGISGFTTYLNSIRGLDDFEIVHTYDCINCDFESSSNSNLSPAEKKHIRSIAGERGLKICRPNGFPEFIRHDRGLIRLELNADEIEALGTALEAGIEVARKIKALSFKEMEKLGLVKGRPYATADGGMRIPMLEMQEDKSFKWSETVTPKVENLGFPILPFTNAFSLAQLKSIKSNGTFQCKVIHMMTSMKIEEGIINPLVIIVIDDEGMASPVLQTSEIPHAEEEVLNQLVFFLISIKKRPRTIEVDDDFSESFLKDLCQKADIKLKRTDYLPEPNMIAHMLNVQFMG